MKAGLTENLAQRLRRGAGLLVPHMRVADGDADVFVPEQLLNFP